MVSWAPGANAMTTSAVRNGKKWVTISAKHEATAIATEVEPSAAPT